MTASRYAQMAQRYWTTYLPTQTAQLDDPTTFFQELGQTVAEQVETAAEQTVEPLTPQQAALELPMARKEAEEQTLTELVFLPKEPGTEELELPSSSPLAGWEDDQEQ